jgi:vacuolar-type H+-ATPase subunit F/Vma7
MQSPVFIGDELTATGYRLAGLQVRTPDREQLPATLKWAMENTSLILLGSTCSEMLSQHDLDTLLQSQEPAVVVVQDIQGTSDMTDLSSRLKAQLGMLE